MEKLRKNRKAQLTVFIILGIGLLFIIGIIFYIRADIIKNDAAEQIETGVPDIVAVKRFVSQCIEQTVKEGVLFTARQGGYNTLPEEHLINSIQNTAYYFNLGEDSFPELSIWEAELEKYIKFNLLFCTRGFSTFIEQGVNIRQGSITPKVHITEKSVAVDIQFPITLSYENKSETADEFLYILPVNIKQVHDNLQLFRDAQLRNQGAVCIECLLDSAIAGNYSIIINRVSNSEIMFSMTYEGIQINNKPYQLIFANKYLAVQG